MTEANSYAMRHRARRAVALAEVLRQQWAAIGLDPRDISDPSGMDLADAAAAMSEAGWANAAEVAGISMPSEITRAITIGLLSAPKLEGIVR